MAKLTLTDITAGYDTASISAANNALIEAAVENTLSRDGATPNTMSANLDMNSNKVVNVTDGTNNQDAVTLSQLNAASVVASTAAASAVTLADAGANYTATTAEAAFTELASTANGEGASVIGLEDAAGNLTATDVEAAIAEIFTTNASTANGAGASLIGVEDSAGYYTATDVEGVLAELYETGTFTTDFTGFTVAKAATWNYSRMGKIVVIELDGGVTGTSNSTSFASGATDVPAALRPTETAVKSYVGVQDNGTWQMGVIWVTNAGQLYFSADIAQNSFTASGTKAINGGFTFTYMLD